LDHSRTNVRGSHAPKEVGQVFTVIVVAISLGLFLVPCSMNTTVLRQIVRMISHVFHFMADNLPKDEHSAVEN
jgi:hypothetical protein